MAQQGIVFKLGLFEAVKEKRINQTVAFSRILNFLNQLAVIVRRISTKS